MSLVQRLGLAAPDKRPLRIPRRDAPARVRIVRDDPDQPLGVVADAVRSADNMVGRFRDARVAPAVSENNLPCDRLAEGEVQVRQARVDLGSSLDPNREGSGVHGRGAAKEETYQYYPTSHSGVWQIDRGGRDDDYQLCDNGSCGSPNRGQGSIIYHLDPVRLRDAVYNTKYAYSSTMTVPISPSRQR